MDEQGASPRRFLGKQESRDGVAGGFAHVNAFKIHS
jgi:hypothetical protein